MKFKPSLEFQILCEENYKEEMEKVTEALMACRTSGYFEGYGNVKLFYEYFLCENATASVVIVHGLSEFSKKFYETAYYFLNQGYNVFIYDQRCHGYSERFCEDTTYLHVDSFKEYVKDLKIFIDSIVLAASDTPIYMYAHSMGGATAALYLALNKGKVQKAVLSSALFDPVKGPVLPVIARLWVKAHKILRGNKAKSDFSKEFNPNTTFNQSSDISEARFNHNMALRREDVHYQSGPFTWGWTYASLLLRNWIMKKRIVGGIETPTLLISSEKDAVVRNDAHVEFNEKCSVCRHIIIKDATHALLSSDNETLKKYLDLILDFYRE